MWIAGFRSRLYLRHMNMDQKKITTIAVLAGLVVLGFFGWQMWYEGEDEGPSLFTTQEPVNPFEESTNPYENIKTNPFE